MSTPRLSISAARLLAVLESMTPAQRARVSNAVLAGHIHRATQGHRSRTVNRALAELADAGLIRIEYRRPNAGGVGTDPVARTIHLIEQPPSEEVA